MSRILLFVIILFSFGCSKPKAVFICGDHACVNKSEAKQYFEENLSIEVKVFDKNKKNQLDLVELNLTKDEKKDKKISLQRKIATKKNLKKLTKNEIKNIKKSVRNKKNLIKLAKKKELHKNKVSKVKKENLNKKKDLNFINSSIKSHNVEDVCSIIEICNIDEISKYLINEGKRKGFPDITTR